MSETPSKLMPLADAVGRFVRPGMHLHFASTPSRSNASVREVARRFRGTSPAFALSATGFHSTAHLLAILRLGASYISCFFGDNYPTPRPNPVYAAVVAEGALLEHWSLESYVAALRAGARGEAYAPTRSLRGTSLGAELKAAGKFVEAADPSGNEPIGLVRAMRPDVAFLHAAMGDAGGYFIAAPPYAEGFWSAFAAKAGVIVTVERLVKSVREGGFADAIKVPPYRVLAVCEEPFGAHPQPGYAAPHEESPDGYVDDFAHYEIWRRLTTDAVGFAQFSERVLSVRDGSAAYRAFVGEARLAELRDATSRFDGRAGTGARRGRASDPEETWKTRSCTSIRAVPAPVLSANTALSVQDRLVLLAARTIVRRVVERGHEAILAGIGASFAACRVAKLILAEGGRNVEVMVETGLVDLECGESADPFLLAWTNVAQAGRLSSVEDVLGTLTCGAENRCLGVVGAAEIDARGDINSTKLPNGELLVGSGGANDIASSCGDVVVVVRCEPGRLVPRAHYVTSPGRAVSAIATDQCVFLRESAGERWTVRNLYRDAASVEDRDAALAAIRTACRFPDLDLTRASFAERPSHGELAALAVVGERRERRVSTGSRAGGQ